MMMMPGAVVWWWLIPAARLLAQNLKLWESRVDPISPISHGGSATSQPVTTAADTSARSWLGRKNLDGFAAPNAVNMSLASLAVFTPHSLGPPPLEWFPPSRSGQGTLCLSKNKPYNPTQLCQAVFARVNSPRWSPPSLALSSLLSLISFTQSNKNLALGLSHKNNSLLVPQ
ncbi:hypothetical protein QBC35DRAFT_471843 [Podospora australis]|uniref:Secreted protein n=1 Tax=Podospora australis TaxID=1536484 RepID=A0AAN7AKV3_9PEZI|nr:hypothetical protein QBC35DRAFT_471843 [Podospora australis]